MTVTVNSNCCTGLNRQTRTTCIYSNM